MARVHLELPPELPFSTEVRVRISDVNYGGHLGNDAVLSLVHEARVRFLAARGYSELDLGGPGILMTDCAVRYLAEGRYGQRIRVEVGAGEFGRSGFDLFYRLVDAQTGERVAEAKTGIVCYDYGARKACRLPPGVREALGGG
jgi:acyl-CoA thioesterase FadM